MLRDANSEVDVEGADSPGAFLPGVFGGAGPGAVQWAAYTVELGSGLFGQLREVPFCAVSRRKRHAETLRTIKRKRCRAGPLGAPAPS